MKRTTLIRIVTFSAAALTVAVIFAVTGWIKVSEYKRSYELTYRRAFTDLCDSMSKIDSELSKSLYANSGPLLVTLANNISRYSESAKSALSILPTADMSLDKTSEFITQVGDFSITLARKAAGGTQISEEELSSLSTMSQTASTLSSELSTLYQEVNNKNFFQASSTDVLSQAESAEENTPANFADGISTMEANMPESPVLIYDGPYSSHITQTVPQYLLKGDAEISQSIAQGKAANFLGISKPALEFVSKTEGDKVVYTFSTNDGAESYISVTAVGGYVVSYSGSYIPGAAAISPEDAVSVGSAFLSSKGYADMLSSYHYTAGGICYINYEYVENGVVVYPDLIQLGVALDSGKVTYMDASGYLNNNKSGRDLTPAISSADAAGKLSSGLTPEGDAKLCIIPSPGENEILCYEFKCTGANGNSYLVYIDAKTGLTQNIFLLVVDENGTLTL